MVRGCQVGRWEPQATGGTHLPLGVGRVAHHGGLGAGGRGAAGKGLAEHVGRAAAGSGLHELLVLGAAVLEPDFDLEGKERGGWLVECTYCLFALRSAALIGLMGERTNARCAAFSFV